MYRPVPGSVRPDGPPPSAVGYQPTLANEVGSLQERITSKGRVHHLLYRRFMSLRTT